MGAMEVRVLARLGETCIVRPCVVDRVPRVRVCACVCVLPCAACAWRALLGGKGLLP